MAFSRKYAFAVSGSVSGYFRASGGSDFLRETLQRYRLGASEDDVKWLISKTKESSPIDDKHDPPELTLCATSKDVMAANSRAQKRLSGQDFRFDAKIEWGVNTHQSTKVKCELNDLAPETLCLKEGALVMLMRQTRGFSEGYTRGYGRSSGQGIVRGVLLKNPIALSDTIHDFRAEWHEVKNKTKEIIVRRRQFPLKLVLLPHLPRQLAWSWRVMSSLTPLQVLGHLLDLRTQSFRGSKTCQRSSRRG